ncbi:MAG: AbrB/MazE/SpoVT family DNA-binding domain-containing protein [bacterium]
MKKHLVKHGNSLALVIDKGALELLEIDADTPLRITTDGHCLIVTPVRDDEGDRKFKESLAEGNRRYGKMLKRLAD